MGGEMTGERRGYCPRDRGKVDLVTEFFWICLN